MSLRNERGNERLTEITKMWINSKTKESFLTLRDGQRILPLGTPLCFPINFIRVDITFFRTSVSFNEDLGVQTRVPLLPSGNIVYTTKDRLSLIASKRCRRDRATDEGESFLLHVLLSHMQIAYDPHLLPPECTKCVRLTFLFGCVYYVSTQISCACSVFMVIFSTVVFTKCDTRSDCCEAHKTRRLCKHARTPLKL